MNNSDMPAMPHLDDCISTHQQEIYAGLTKREHFAGLAMQGFISAGVNGMPNASKIAELSIKYAEEVLRQLGE